MNAARMETPEAGTSIAEYSATAQALAELRNKYADVVYDVRSSKGMAAAKLGRAELRDLRTALEKTRVEIKADALTRCRNIDGEAARLRAELSALEDPIGAQIKSEENRKAEEKAAAEQAERDRVAAVNARFDAIKALPSQATGTADECRALIAQAEAIDPASFPDDLVQSAKFEQRMAIAGLRAALDRIEQADADRAELEKLRETAEAVRIEGERLAQIERDREAEERRRADEQAQAEREQQIRAEAAEQAQRDAAEAVAAAERRATAEAERAELAELQRQEDAERDRVQAAAVAAQAEADKAEAVRQAQELAARQEAAREAERLAVQREQEEADAKRAANRAHVGRINAAARDALIAGGIDAAAAQNVVVMIATGKVPAVSITY